MMIAMADALVFWASLAVIAGFVAWLIVGAWWDAHHED